MLCVFTTIIFFKSSQKKTVKIKKKRFIELKLVIHWNIEKKMKRQITYQEKLLNMCICSGGSDTPSKFPFYNCQVFGLLKAWQLDLPLDTALDQKRKKC